MGKPTYVSQTGAGSSPWILINYHGQPVNTIAAVDVTGVVNYTVEFTFDDILTVGAPAPVVWSDPALASKTTNQWGYMNEPYTAVRLTVNSGAGTARMAIIQAGIKG